MFDHHAGSSAPRTHRSVSRIRSLVRTFLRPLAVAVIIAALAAPTAVLAVAGLELTTPFPAVAVEPGARATFPLRIDVSQARRVDLRVTGAPDGWETTIRGGGFIVDGAFIRPGEDPEIEIEVDVPADAAAGSFPVTVEARSGGLVDALRLDLRVAEQAAGEVALTSDFPQLRGPATGSAFSFTIQLRNDTPEEAQFNLTATGPAGWQVDARPSGQSQATSATVDAGGTSTINVSATPPDSVEAGTYPILLQAAGAGRTAEIELSVEVTGTFDMELTTPNGVLSTNATAGSTKDFQLRVINRGSATLENVEITASTPSGWTAPAEPATIASIPPEGEADVTVRLTPSGEAIAGDYVVTFRANAGDASAEAEVRVTVETALTWAIVGILLIVAALAGLGWVFQRYGRR